MQIEKSLEPRSAELPFRETKLCHNKLCLSITEPTIKSAALVPEHAGKKGVNISLDTLTGTDKQEME